MRVGYVVENPIWKTSYRLVLDKKEKPFLQGWAVVENPSDEDWKDVRMVAGVGPADFVPDGPVSAAVRAAAGGRAGTVRFAAAADLFSGDHERQGPAGQSEAPAAAMAPAVQPRLQLGKLPRMDGR